MRDNARPYGLIALLVPFVIAAIAVIFSITNQVSATPDWNVPNGDAAQGPDAIQRYGCGSCHTIRGVVGADGKVGPNLSDLANHSFIAGRLPNRPDNLVMWIQHPQEVSPGTAMPDLGVTEAAARDIAAYLYQIR